MLQFFIVAFIIFIIAFQVNHFHSSVTNAPNTAPARMEETDLESLFYLFFFFEKLEILNKLLLLFL